MIIPYGIYKGQDITTVPDDYLLYLCERGKSTYYKSRHSLDIKFKWPIELWVAARAEASNRGYTKNGERWIRINV